MRISEAKQIPIEVLAEYLGGKISHRRDDEIWLFSPLRPNERTASFKVNTKRNTWHDFGHSGGQGSGGDILDLWCEYHRLDRKTGITQALQALQNFRSTPLHENIREIVTLQKERKQARFEIIKLSERIWHTGLLQELSRRRISVALASQYLKQAYIRDNKYPNRKINGFAFNNDNKGWEISIPNPHKGNSFKTCIGGKAPTTIVGNDYSKALIFEGFWDFLSWLEMNKQIIPEGVTYVLNSVSFIPVIANRLTADKNIKTKLEFLDNDLAGQNATLLLAELLANCNYERHSMNYIYQAQKDLNEYWQSLI